MKTTLITCLCSAALALTAFAQPPAGTPEPTTTTTIITTTPGAPASAAAPTATVARVDDNDLQSRIEKKVKHGLNISVGDDDRGDHVRARKHNGSDFDEGALMAIPIVGIIFSTLFGAPVLIVGLILFFSYWKQRSLHRTVRMMVEKGQPVPEGLFASPNSPARQRNDMRRGITLTMIGLGIMIFLGAVNDWNDGSWAVGVIPFLIGAGYLLVWKLDANKRVADNTPRVS
ncbi:MAG: DUF6249 domain-containing protein [Chthoniobacterales bacterium]